MTYLLFSSLAAAIIISLPQSQGWRGIVPLHSTRADVERVLGRSADRCNCIYKTEDDVVSIEYASDSCKRTKTGWNVPADTVIRVRVAPKKVRLFSELQSDGRNYRKVKDLHTEWVYYFDDKEGKMFEVSSDGVVGAVNYIPAAAEAYLRCPGASSKRVLSYPTFDQYGEIAFGYEKARLQNFAAKLSHNPDSIGYIVLYPGAQTRQRVVRRRAQRAKDYVVNVSRIQADRVRIIVGGRKERITTELYLLSAGEAPPRPDPE